MKALLKLSRCIDACTECIGRVAVWFVLIIVLFSSLNAVLRYLFNFSSNAFLEAQWYLFGLIFLSCSGYTLLRNEHVRIDLILHKLPKRGQIWVDILGILFFLMPMAIAIMTLSWPVFVNAFLSDEMSNSPGGLIVWPARLMIPVGFFLLILQAISELIKRIGFLKGLCPDPTQRNEEASAEDELIKTIRLRQNDETAAGGEK